MTSATFRGLRILEERNDIHARWGARAIITDGCVDIPPGRFFLEVEGLKRGSAEWEAFKDLLFDDTGSGDEHPGLIEELNNRLTRGHFNHEPKQIGLIGGSDFTFYWQADTRNSGGYLYIGAAIKFDHITEEVSA